MKRTITLLLALVCAVTALYGCDKQQNETDPTENTVKTVKATEATEPSTEITAPSTEATEPTTEATDPTTQATEPTTQATEPPTQATEPPTEAPTEATEPEMMAPTKSFNVIARSAMPEGVNKEYSSIEMSRYVETLDNATFLDIPFADNIGYNGAQGYFEVAILVCESMEELRYNLYPAGYDKKHFDESFFENNALLVFVGDLGSSSDTHSIDQIIHIDSELCFKITAYGYSGPQLLDAGARDFSYVTIPKSELETIDTIGFA